MTDTERLSGEHPYWVDDCRHLERGEGLFVGSTVSGKYKWDVYIWKGEITRPSVCIRYGLEGDYISPYGTVEELIEPESYAANAYGPAIDLIKAYIARNPNYKQKLGL